MPDCKCAGTGFISNGDYVDKRRVTHKHIPSVRRCPAYTEYFLEIADLFGAQVIRGPGICSAAANRHEELKLRGEKKDGKKGRGRF